MTWKLVSDYGDQAMKFAESVVEKGNAKAFGRLLTVAPEMYEIVKEAGKVSGFSQTRQILRDAANNIIKEI